MSVVRPTGKPAALPAWPLAILFCGIAPWWLLGALTAAPLIMAAVMGVLLLRHGARRVPGMLPWGGVVLCAFASVISMGRISPSLISWGLQWGTVAAAGVILVYVVSARENISRERVILYLTVSWFTIVALGFLAMAFPYGKITTPLAYVMPASLAGNDFVAEMIRPAMSEIQQPWGASEPFYRPSAPFAYANGWGAAYALLTPVVLAFTTLRRTRWAKVLMVLVLGASLAPALETGNRTMLGALAASVVVALVRFLLDRRWAAATAVGGAGVFALAAFFVSGAADAIRSRTTLSSTTNDRLELYSRTWERTLDSPFIGHGRPELDPVVGVSFGTQGMLWLLLYAFGIPAAIFFLWFLVGVLLRSWRLVDTAQVWLWTVPVVALVCMFFYNLNSLTAAVLLSVCGLLLRDITPAPPNPRRVIQLSNMRNGGAP